MYKTQVCIRLVQEFISFYKRINLATGSFPVCVSLALNLGHVHSSLS